MAQIMLLLTLENSKLRLCAGQLENGQFLLEPLHRSQSTKEKTLKILQDTTCSFVGTIRSDQNILATCTETILFQKVQFAVFTNTFEK